MTQGYHKSCAPVFFSPPFLSFTDTPLIFTALLLTITVNRLTSTITPLTFARIETLTWTNRTTNVLGAVVQRAATL